MFYYSLDRLTTEISKLTHQDLTDFIYDTSKIASGLGEEVYTKSLKLFIFILKIT